MCQGGKPDTGKIHSSYIGMNVCGSAYENRCVAHVCYGNGLSIINKESCCISSVSETLLHFRTF